MKDAWTEQELREEVLAAPRRAFVPLPDTQVIERPGWMQIVTPSLRQGGLNEVALAVLPEAEADEIIDRTLRQYRDLGLRFRWIVCPESRPADLADRLRRRGLRGSELRGMYRPTRGLAAPAGADITVEEVDERTVEEFTRAMAAGWEMDPAPLLPLHRLVVSRADAGQHLFLARYQGQAAGTAGMVTFPRSAYLMGAVVLPALRARGLYRALVAARLAHAAARGIPLATSQARTDTSAPILERLGFRTLCTFPSFTND